jgi:putative intracellular protease/amidase
MFAEAPSLEVLLVPGGAGAIAAMEIHEMLSFVRRQAAGAKIIFSVCAGAFILGTVRMREVIDARLAIGLCLAAGVRAICTRILKICFIFWHDCSSVKT